MGFKFSRRKDRLRWRSALWTVPYSAPRGTVDCPLRMNGISLFSFFKIMSQYLVFKFERFIELTSSVKVSKLAILAF